MPKKLPPKEGCHSGESRDPGFSKAFWTPAFAEHAPKSFAGVTDSFCFSANCRNFEGDGEHQHMPGE
jgi:hypothetical protein